MEMRIGASGYSFDDWKGEFYPASLPKGKMLEFYVQYFSTVEINATYYRNLTVKAAATMAQKAPRGFDFMVKAHQSYTHERPLAAENRGHYLTSIAPFTDTGVLAGILAQFPQSFHFTPSNLQYVLDGREYFGLSQRLFVEFRHDSWSTHDSYLPIRDAGIGWVSTDLPSLPHLPTPEAVIAGDIGYLRLHGRNQDAWHTGGDTRYDYLYSPAELAEWKAKLERLKKKTTQVYVFFNNCYRGQAVRNAREFIELFRL